MRGVYRATDTKLDREVAIKGLTPEIAGSPRMRFLREAKTASALNHPNVCSRDPVPFRCGGILP